ncbi:DUF6973 domain-containing protein [Polaromonas sp. LjRoot131]|uniref:DUF6973 domain-containing protein n=1 Tax=Polaromonas sp. LjRoot131 TaxID=3342262 RepID=UPI003ECE73CA
MGLFDQYLAVLTPAAKQSIQEMSYSGLPGRTDGPADAYRHLLWAAELTRRLGQPLARAVLDGHEFMDFGANPQNAAQHAIDYHNNAMAESAPPVMGQMDLSAAQLAALAPVLAANWQ